MLPSVENEKDFRAQYGTVGGLDVDVNLNVLREDGSPIANLNAVGQDSEGVCNIDGKAYTP